jgi:hypothetical protein
MTHTGAVSHLTLPIFKQRSNSGSIFRAKRFPLDIRPGLGDYPCDIHMIPSAYSAEFSKLRFQTALPRPLAEISSRLGVPTSVDSEVIPPMKNVYPLRTGSRTRFVVKYFIARCQYSFGIFYDAETAARLADMILVKFAHLRQHSKMKILGEDSLNFTVAQAQRDLENEGEINSLLTQFLCSLDESLLTKRTPKQRTPARAAIYAVKEEIIRELSDQISQLSERLNERLDIIERAVHTDVIRHQGQIYIGDPLPPVVTIGTTIEDLPSSPIFGANTCCANSPVDGSVSPQ